MVRLVGHERQEGVPREVGHVHVKELQSHGDEGEVDQLQRRPHQTVHHVGLHVYLAHFAPGDAPHIYATAKF